jgi:hypothetical protein
MRVWENPQAYPQFMSELRRHIPASTLSSLSISEQLIAPYHLELPYQVWQEVSNFFQAWSRSVDVSSGVGFSSCLDFHWLPESGELKLIEVNTNAAFMGLSLPLYRAFQLTPSYDEDVILQLFLSECSPRHRDELALVDEQPSQQKLFVEFLWYQNLFSKLFAEVRIKDRAEVSGQEGAIYNRCTDFLLEEEASRILRTYWQQWPQAISPNPAHYLRLADKNLLLAWQNSPELAPYIPKTQWLTPDNKDELWQQRKALFFKPSRSFGSKMTYKGASISRTHFDRLFELPAASMIAQELCPPGQVETPRHGVLKFDLRFYFSKQGPLAAVARLYQGQVTNTQTPGGGFAPVTFSSSRRSF